jgi:hypothetical protein
MILLDNLAVRPVQINTLRRLPLLHSSLSMRRNKADGGGTARVVNSCGSIVGPISLHHYLRLCRRCLTGYSRKNGQALQSLALALELVTKLEY